MPSTLQTTKDWRNYFADIGLAENVLEMHLQYVEKLLSNNVPVIFDFQHFAKLLGRTEEYLASAVHGTTAHYRLFAIPKRRGGTRVISAPYPALLQCQQWILLNITSRLTVHSAAHGFLSRRSILTNAARHLGNGMVLKMDLEEFFPSVVFERVISVFNRLGYSPYVAFLLARMCTLKGSLPQGGATSPSLSNIVATRLDRRLSALGKKVGFVYSRYADDLVFSGDVIHFSLVKIVTRICTEEGFKVNERKTKLIDVGARKIVTGIDISSGKLRVPRPFRRAVQRDVYYILKFGIKSHAAKRKLPIVRTVLATIGKLSFWRSVEPENEFVRNAMVQLEEVKRAMTARIQRDSLRN
ncbi:MAG: reverse transcriptase family protein [Betaproteobacteria bacterium]